MGSNGQKQTFCTNKHPIAAVKLSLRLPTAPDYFPSICGGPRVDCTNEHPIAAVKLSMRLRTAPDYLLSICEGLRVDL